MIDFRHILASKVKTDTGGCCMPALSHGCLHSNVQRMRQLPSRCRAGPQMWPRWPCLSVRAWLSLEAANISIALDKISKAVSI